jgi:RNA polymerase primary sigma factor
MTGKVLTGKDIERILIIAQDVVSLNTPVSSDPDCEGELFDYLEDPSPTPEEAMILAGRKEYLLDIIQRYLKPREAQIIILRFGLESDNPMTLREVGEELGITRERVRQLEERALRRLRVYFAKNNLTTEDI